MDDQKKTDDQKETEQQPEKTNPYFGRKSFRTGN